MPLINCKVELSLTVAGADSATFQIIDAKRFVPVVTLLTEDSAKISNQLSKGFKRPVYWNKYRVIDKKVVKMTSVNEEKIHKRIPWF